MPLTTTEHLREILTEMFGLDRAESLNVDQSEALPHLGGKALDAVDFRLFVEERFSVRLPEHIVCTASLKEIADLIDAAKPTDNPH